MTITPLHTLSGYIWFNDQLVDWQEAKIHVLTHGLHYSGAVFEGERAYNGKIFKLEEHTQRLINSAHALGLQVPYSFSDIITAHKLLLEKNNISNAYVRPIIWRGPESLNITNRILSSNVAIIAVPSSPKHMNDIVLHVSRWHKPPPNSMPPQCKSSGHYNMMMTIQQEAQAKGYDDAILLDQRCYVAECTTSNIFFVKGDELITPIADVFLNGITRQTVIDIAHKLGMKVKEKYVVLAEISSYTECFITGTAAEIKRVKSIDIFDEKIIFTDDKTTKLLQTEYNILVNS